VEKRQERYFLRHEVKEKWIEYYVDRETAVVRKRVQHVETAIKQEQEDMRNAEKAGLTTRKPKTTFEEILNAIGDSLSSLPSSHDEEDGEYEQDNEDKTELGKLSKMMDLTGRWVKSPKRYSSAWKVFS